MESAWSGLFRGWRLLSRAVDTLATQHAASAQAAEVSALVAEARTLAQGILDGRTSAEAAVHALHTGPVQRLGHPADLVAWCDLDHGRWQDPERLRLVPAAGAEKQRAAEEEARALLARDPDALADDLRDHLARDEALRSGWLRRAVQIVLAILVVGLPSYVVVWSVQERQLPAFGEAMVVVFVTGFLLRQWVRSLGEGSATSVHGHEGREIILLRPFGEDRVAGEEALVAALSRWGLVRAIGRPGQTLPPLGAHRVYLHPDGERWKAAAARLIQSADAIVLRVGAEISAGFRWEIEYIVAHEDPTRVVVALPTSPGPYASFREAAGNLFPKPLPAERPPGALFFGFDDAWRPVPLPPDRRGRWQSLTDRYEGALSDHLAAAAAPDRPPVLPLPAPSGPA